MSAADAQRTRALLVARQARELADGLKLAGGATFRELGGRFDELADVVIDLLATLETERRDRGRAR